MTTPLQVLVIDDDNDVRSSLAFVLQSLGHGAILAVDTEDGVAKFTASQPALVFCDMVMPGVLGIEAVRAIRALSADVTIVAMSGSDEAGRSSLLTASRAAGADFCLGKPFDFVELEALLDQVAEKVASRAS